MSRIKSRASYIYHNIEGDTLWVLKVYRRTLNNENYAVVYFPETGYRVSVPYYQVRNKVVKDRRKKTILDIGYLGDQYEIIKEEDPELCNRLYNCWKFMIYRCYKPDHKSHKSYADKGVVVQERWHDFSKFFYDVQKIPGYIREEVLKHKLSLDKDCKQQGVDENKIYSFYTCVWLSAKDQQKYVDHYTPQKKVQLKVYHPNGDITIEEGLGRISRKYNVDMKCMNRVLKGLQQSTKGYKFEYIQNKESGFVK